MIVWTNNLNLETFLKHDRYIGNIQEKPQVRRYSNINGLNLLSELNVLKEILQTYV
jgi:hypothetical protein